MEYVDKNFKRKVDCEKLCNKSLIFLKKGRVGAVFLYKHHLIKKTIVDKHICNEATMLIRINEMMDEKKIPNLFSKLMLAYKCKHIDFIKYAFYHELSKRPHDNYIFILDRYEQPIWQEIDSKNSKKVKSIVMLLLISIWFINHIVNIYHDDIVAGKPDNLIINNVLIEKTSKKKIAFSLLNKKKKINIKLYGYQTRIIDFGGSCYKDIHTQEKIRVNDDTSLNKFYDRNISFKNFKFKSEVIFVIKCLLSYWKLDKLSKIDKLLFEYYSKIAKKYKSMNKFDEEIIYDFDKNFMKIIGMFSNKWPNPPYYDE